jgi:hypothetical protein
MNELVLFTGDTLPTPIDATGDQARMRFLEFFPPMSATRTRGAPTRRHAKQKHAIGESMTRSGRPRTREGGRS